MFYDLFAIIFAMAVKQITQLLSETSFLIDLTCQKSAGMVSNGDHVTLGLCHYRKYMPIAKWPNDDHITMGMQL